MAVRCSAIAIKNGLFDLFMFIICKVKNGVMELPAHQTDRFNVPFIQLNSKKNKLSIPFGHKPSEVAVSLVEN